ncbi:MAG: hypothetical protein ACQEUT_08135 [Bacillota bacterium]
MPNNKREPKKTWYWVPFTGAILITIIVVTQVIYMKTPKVGPWASPDTGDLLRAVGWGAVMVFLFILQGINGLYQYKKQKEKIE